jgi:hypothetical protein
LLWKPQTRTLVWQQQTKERALTHQLTWRPCSSLPIRKLSRIQVESLINVEHLWWIIYNSAALRYLYQSHFSH